MARKTKTVTISLKEYNKLKKLEAKVKTQKSVKKPTKKKSTKKVAKKVTKKVTKKTTRTKPLSDKEKFKRHVKNSNRKISRRYHQLVEDSKYDRTKATKAQLKAYAQHRRSQSNRNTKGLSASIKKKGFQDFTKKVLFDKYDNSQQQYTFYQVADRDHASSLNKSIGTAEVNRLLNKMSEPQRNKILKYIQKLMAAGETYIPIYLTSSGFKNFGFKQLLKRNAKFTSGLIAQVHGQKTTKSYEVVPGFYVYYNPSGDWIDSIVAEPEVGKQAIEVGLWKKGNMMKPLMKIKEGVLDFSTEFAEAQKYITDVYSYARINYEKASKANKWKYQTNYIMTYEQFKQNIIENTNAINLANKKASSY